MITFARWLTVLVLTMCSISRAAGADDERAVFLVFPVTTSLQKALLGEKTSAYVLVDGDRVLDGTRVDAAALNFLSLRDKLTPHRRKEKGSVRFDIRTTALPEPIRGADNLLSYALVGFTHTYGFGRARATIRFTGTPWLEETRNLRGHPRSEPGVTEPASGDGLVQVHPVRTRLSRFLARNSDVVVDLVQPFKKLGDEDLTPEIRKSIRRHVNSLKLDARDRILFRVGSEGQSGRDAWRRFSGFMLPGASPAVRLARKLGFRHATVSGLR